jgi:hypothetical protein
MVHNPEDGETLLFAASQYAARVAVQRMFPEENISAWSSLMAIPEYRSYGLPFSGVTIQVVLPGTRAAEAVLAFAELGALSASAQAGALRLFGNSLP